MSRESFAVHLLNLPVGVRWRQIKAELLLASGIPEDTVLHIQVLDRCAVVSLNNRAYGDVLVDELDGAQYRGQVLIVRTQEQLSQFLPHQASSPYQPVMFNPYYQQPPYLPPMTSMANPIVPPQDYYHHHHHQPYSVPMLPPPPPLPLPLPPSSSSNSITASSYLSPGSYMLPQTAATTTTATTTNTNTNTNTTTTLNSSPSVSPRVLQSLRQYPYQTITDLDPIPDRTRLFIGNIPYSSEWRDLKDYLRNAGSILRVEIPSESDGASKGFAVATYASEPDAVRAIELFNGVMFQGRPLTVRFDRFPVRSRDVRTEYYKSPTGQQEEEEEQGEEKGTIQADNEDGIAESIVGKRVEALKIPEGPVLQKEKDDDRRFEDEARNLIESLSVNNM